MFLALPKNLSRTRLRGVPIACPFVLEQLIGNSEESTASTTLAFRQRHLVHRVSFCGLDWCSDSPEGERIMNARLSDAAHRHDLGAVLGEFLLLEDDGFTRSELGHFLAECERSGGSEFRHTIEKHVSVYRRACQVARTHPPVE